MNKYFSLFIFCIFTLCFQNSLAQAEEFFGIGAELSQDTFNKKIIIVDIINGTPAQKSGLEVGDEIIKVDGKKIKKLCICEVISMIRGEENTTVKLVIKKNFFKRKTVELTREKIYTQDAMVNPLFDSNWMQIATPCFQRPKWFLPEISKKFSKKYQKTVIAQNNYWFKRKQTFEIGFNSCMSYSNKNNQETCLIHLLDRESAVTNTDKALYKFLRN